jgi:hypothetical protein
MFVVKGDREPCDGGSIQNVYVLLHYFPRASLTAEFERNLAILGSTNRALHPHKVVSIHQQGEVEYQSPAHLASASNLPSNVLMSPSANALRPSTLVHLT